MPTFGGNKISASRVSPKWFKSNEPRKKREERKSVITMVSTCTPEPTRLNYFNVAAFKLGCFVETK